MKKLGKTTRPFRYDLNKLNQIPYDYTVELSNRFKGLELIDRVPENYGQRFCNIVEEAVAKTIPKKKKCNKAKWLSEEALTNSLEKKRSKRQRRKGRIHPSECRVPKKSKVKKTFFSE